MSRNFIMNGGIAVAALVLCAGSLCAETQEARCIWHTGDYGIWWGNMLQSDGLEPASPGFATYGVKPNFGGPAWIEGDVTTPWGKIHVRADKNGHKVTENRR
jgi:hypothetical protein